MRNSPILSLLLALITVLTGCASSSEAPGVRLGMTGEELRTQYGKPIRIERTPSGGEDWYYNYSSWGTPGVRASSVSESPSSSIGVSITSTRHTEQRPIHLSLDGHVIGPLPKGSIVR
jgi:hypothetical protein